MNYSLSPASIGGRTRRRRGGVETLPQVVGGRRQRGGEDGEMVAEEQMGVDEQMGGGYKQRGGVDGAVAPVRGEGQNGNDEVMLGAGYMMPKRRRQQRRQSRRQSRRQRKGGEKKSKKSKKSRSKSRQRR